MPEITDKVLHLEDLVVAARQIVRRQEQEEDDEVISMFEVLNKLIDAFGGRFRVSGEAWTALQLVEELFLDPEVENVTDCGIEFCWAGEEPARFPSGS